MDQQNIDESNNGGDGEIKSEFDDDFLCPMEWKLEIARGNSAPSARAAANPRTNSLVHHDNTTTTSSSNTWVLFISNL